MHILPNLRKSTKGADSSSMTIIPGSMMLQEPGTLDHVFLEI